MTDYSDLLSNVRDYTETDSNDLSDSIILKSNYSTRTLQSDGEAWLVINKIG